MTFRTVGSLPTAVIEEIRERRRLLDKDVAEGKLSDSEALLEDKRLFAFYDAALDNGFKSSSGCFADLHKPEFAPHLVNAIQSGAKLGHYLLHRFCVMPNHAHLLIEPCPAKMPAEIFKLGFPGITEEIVERKLRDPHNPDYRFMALQDIMRGIKGVAARNINQSAGRTGPLFQQESFDHYVRDETSYWRIIDYIDQNPVKAGLTASPNQNPWRG